MATSPASSLQRIDVDAPPPLLQMRAAMLEPLGVFSAKDLRRALERLAANRWNAVVVPAFVEGYPIFPSEVWASYGFQRQHRGFSKWNPFEVAFEVAWRHGLDVFVSLQPYLAREGSLVRRVSRLFGPRAPGWLAARHPSRRQRRAEQAAPTRSYYCPVHPDYRRFLGDTLHALIEDYPFHGMLIDLRHYPFYTGGSDNYLPWCYCEACRDGTLRDLGFDPAGVNFDRERPMVERWKEWQTAQMDRALAYLRQRVFKARRSTHILGLLTTDSGLADSATRPMIHWKTWIERSLVEALVLDTYSPKLESFERQVREDLKTLPRNSLLFPMLPRKAADANAFLRVYETEPVPGLFARFDNWNAPDFDPALRVTFDAPARAVGSDPIGEISAIFDQMAFVAPQEKEFIAFLGDLRRVLTRTDARLSLDRLMVVAGNIRGLYDKVAEGRMDFGREQDRILHDLDLAVRLAYLVACDLVE